MTTFKLNEEKLKKSLAVFLDGRDRMTGESMLSSLVRNGALEELSEPEWRPDDRETFWYIDSETGIRGGSFALTMGGHVHLQEIGNCFRTRELAEEAAEKIRNVLREAKHS